MKKECIFVFCFIFTCYELFGHDQIVHRAITVNASAVAVNHSPAFNSFINIISPDRGLQQATNSMSDGSFEEDDGPTNILNGGGGYRSLNHFYDPVYSNYGRGLSDSIPDNRANPAIGTNSFAWASISNSAGIDHWYNPHPVNTWSWQNAHSYEWIGLTATS
ncbi:MAG TPA: hypothetical protein VHY30_02120 [Verrucomicrobiae bacterium]|jgi:hypothetical protein|nr:hypothetical protein [Verrucomicrobiae bacterium]